MKHILLTCGALYGALAVALGAFGAHALKARLAPELLAHWGTATQYLALHALALLATGMLIERQPPHRSLTLAGQALLLGAAIFSGSLYLRVLLDMPSWGMVTPLGGALLILGWLLLAFGLWRQD
ncbi:MAG: DUF423 domain-containing protein [Chromatiaceae bacterium]